MRPLLRFDESLGDNDIKIRYDFRSLIDEVEQIGRVVKIAHSKRLIKNTISIMGIYEVTKEISTLI
jgi:hypothetical protein